MRVNKESQIKDALVAARDLAALKDERRRSSTLAEGTLSEYPAVAASQRALQHVIASCLVKAGSEVDRFEQARARYEAELRCAADDALAAAIKQSSGEKLRLRAALDGRRKALDTLATGDPTVLSPQRFLVNTPFLIWPTHGVFFDSSQVVPSNSWAKFKVDSSRSNGYEEMSFYFLWDNPNDKIAVINVDAYLVLNGHCRVGSGGGVFPSILSGDRYSQLDLHAQLHILEWWNQPPTSPLPQTDQDQRALFLATNTGGWGSVGAFKVANVFRGYDLRHTLMLVPPHGVVVFEVAASMSYSNANGAIAVDFASGGFEVVCPAVLVTLLS